MAQLKNKGVLPIALPAGHVIPARGELQTTNEAIRGDNWPTLSGLVLSGAVEVEYDPELPHEEAVKVDKTLVTKHKQSKGE